VREKHANGNTNAHYTFTVFITLSWRMHSTKSENVFMFNLMRSLKQVIASFFMFAALPSFAANHVIDILVVYTDSTAAKYGGDPSARINQLFQVSNQIYRDSNVDLEIRVAGTLKVDYTDENSAEEALNDITFNRQPAFNSVAAMRDKVHADMVIFYRSYKEIHGGCGLAWTMGIDTQGDFSDPSIKDFMYAHIAFDTCGDFMTAHELGHNMGLRHSHKQDGKGGTFSYALGHGENNKFTTIMAYQSSFNVDYWDGKVYKFSSPELNCKGSPCGVDRRDPVNGADAVYTLNITAPQIANFFEAKSGATSSASSSSLSSTNTSNSSSSANVVSNNEFHNVPSVSTGSGGGSGGGAFTLFGLLLLIGLCVVRK
jgi:hypothetical protein